ncbi:MAG: ornithine cyclodeaminase family protein [Methanomicrobiales archaeon]|nr:ornithine cyclodeaminase family protein [Methanomicrobiales archaeon]MDI6876454.1 ornithine cyclodeaminase family protein [Methanomicrobiales archaeon]
MRYLADPEEGLDGMAINNAIEAVFAAHARGEVQMPPKVYVNLPFGDFRTMPGYVPDLEAAGVKIVSVHPDNRAMGIPTVMALTILLDVRTGAPEAILNATRLTDLRTGAAGAIACRHLAPRKRIALGIIGCGQQAEAQIRAIAFEREIEEVRIWGPTPSRAERLAALFRTLNARCVPIERACDADVLVTATPSRKPLVMDAWVREGTHVNAIGADAPGKQELDPRLLKRARVFVDDREQAVHSGEVNVPIREGFFRPEEIAGTLGEVVIGKKGRESGSEITIFDSTGLAIQDLAIARLALQSAGRRGTELPFP